MKVILPTILTLLTFTTTAQLTLNEVQSANNSTLQDEFGEYDDWIELYNLTQDTIEIGGLILKDQLDTWAIPTGDASTLLPPGGYFLLWADDQEEQGIFHTNFKIASGGEFLGLYESDGTTVIDSISIPALTQDHSYMRCFSGWSATDLPSPLLDNDCALNVGEQATASEMYSIQIIGRELQIETLEKPQNQTKLAVYNLQGQEVLQKYLWDTKFSLSMSNITSGAYLLTLSNNSFLQSKMIVLQ